MGRYDDGGGSIKCKCHFVFAIMNENNGGCHENCMAAGVVRVVGRQRRRRRWLLRPLLCTNIKISFKVMYFTCFQCSTCKL